MATTAATAAAATVTLSSFPWMCRAFPKWACLTPFNVFVWLFSPASALLNIVNIRIWIPAVILFALLCFVTFYVVGQTHWTAFSQFDSNGGYTGPNYGTCIPLALGVYYVMGLIIGFLMLYYRCTEMATKCK